MSSVVSGKRDEVVASLAADMRAGRLTRGDRLAGEHALAERFAVSRGTIRQALDELKAERLITTVMGVGSFVTYDGAPLDQNSGWAKALADAGAVLTTEVLGIEPTTRPNHPSGENSSHSEAQDTITVRRIRREATGRAVSFETATVPAIGPLTDLPHAGLPNGSLSAALTAAGLIVDHGVQEVGVIQLTEQQAHILDRSPGDTFLRSERTARDATGNLVERVVSLLDPQHFTLRLEFGDRP